MCLKDKRCHHPKIATTTSTQCPEKICIMLCITDEQTPISGDYLRRKHIVARQTKLATKDANPATQRETRNTYRWARTGGQDQIILCQPGIDIDQAGTCPDQSSA